MTLRRRRSRPPPGDRPNAAVTPAADTAVYQIDGDRETGGGFGHENVYTPHSTWFDDDRCESCNLLVSDQPRSCFGGRKEKRAGADAGKPGARSTYHHAWPDSRADCRWRARGWC